MKKTLAIFFLLILFQGFINAQETETEVRRSPVQNIRGRVIDSSAGFPLVGVTVHAKSDTKSEYQITDIDGYFLFKDLPVDYYDVTFSMVGYEKFTVSRANLVSGRELFITQHLKESVEYLEEITIESFSRKDLPINMRALVSSRSFSLEETTKFAGSYGDPARMAANFAGVMPARDNRNDIIIRGNSPSGLQWKVDGMEIPNPNHFGATGSTGGPITIINTNLLGNSDFLTSGFPAEYSNTIAGVFDLRMRPGNQFSYEHWAQLGWNGLELGTEGPIHHINNSSYIISYRHSIVDIISRMGITLPETAHYQDFSYKVNMPTKRFGNFALVGLRGNSYIELKDSYKDVDRWMFDSHSEDISNEYRMGVIGLTHNINRGANSLFSTSLYLTGSELTTSIDTFSVVSPEPFRYAHEYSDQRKVSLKSQIKHKFSSQTDFSFGVYADQHIVNFVDSQFVNNAYVQNVNADDEYLRLYRAYGDVLHRLSSSFNTYFGINFQMLENTGEFVVEPRFNVSYNIRPNHTLSFGSGLHSQMQPLFAYYVVLENNTDNNSNGSLKFTRSLHNVLGYDFNLSKDARLKIEAYYQYLFNIPVSVEDSAYSLINYGAEFYIERKGDLKNIGTGENYGVEVTFEKFWSKNYFMLISGSLFESKYTGADGIARNTAFNGNYALNFLAGYEYKPPKRTRALNLGINITYAGGMPYVPYDVDASMANQQVLYDWNNAYTVNREDYRRISFRIGMRRNEDNFSIETAFDFQYRTNYTSVYLDRLDLQTGEIVQTYRMGFYPMGTIRISF